MPTSKLLLLTNDGSLMELIDSRVEALKNLKDSFPEVGEYSDGTIDIRASLQDGKAYLCSAARNDALPVLIIIDPRVSIADDLLMQSRGDNVNAFLASLSEDYPHIPVLVAAAAPPEEVQRKVLSRSRTGLWLLGSVDPDDPHGDGFAETLAGIATASVQIPLRYTIAVGDQAARYFVERGKYRVARSTAIAYESKDEIQYVLGTIRRYSSINDRTSFGNDWELLLNLGKTLYGLLIKNTVGPQISEILKLRRGAARSQSPKIDLRFEIKVGSPEQEEMFNLPFEFINDVSDRKCFCSRIPMARRLNLGFRSQPKAALSDGAGSGLDGRTDYRVLFMRSEVHGTTTVKLDSGNKLREFAFAKLRSPKKELDSLNACTQPGGERRISTLTVVGSENYLSGGAALAEELRQRLTKGGFDIFHFSGHSIVYPQEGVPYLILPDRPHSALAVPITCVAGWLNEGGCKFMVLSSCEGVSIVTAIETMKGGAEGVVGFRWKVDDELCAGFFDRFYQAYFRQGNSFAESFREACTDVKSEQMLIPTLASAMAVLRD
ncbi:CHAT domain-containing protein [Burkholderia sp. Ac-20365]|uniref:CHAT domain-containing protein n=1 Tax=Burkholderia sp. Ac-20365 TaxID=2703897 RepID=UPI00197B59FA|nr:CHAT domain-containing protein [Burkholderia sp. Ac-20365]MBN3759304.1 CHAT domain-containing protein [Burkholderia sp. Ac-20365]